MRFTLNVFTRAATVLAFLGLSGGFAAAQETTAKNPKREPDRLALEQLQKEMIRAFHDLVAACCGLGSNWCANTSRMLSKPAATKVETLSMRETRGMPRACVLRRLAC